MLKRVLSSSIILVLIFTGIILSDIYLKKSTDEIIEITKLAEIEVSKGDIEKATEHIDTLQEKWQTSRNIIAIFIRHSDVDVVNDSVSKLKVYLQSNDKKDFYAECDSVEFYLKNLADSETYTYYNIL